LVHGMDGRRVVAQLCCVRAMGVRGANRRIKVSRVCRPRLDGSVMFTRLASFIGNGESEGEIRRVLIRDLE